MLNLSELNFKVNTTELLEAKNRIDELAASQQKLANVMSKPVQSSAGASGGNKAVKEQVGLLDKLDQLYGDLAQGATRWEASQLRAARALGLPLQEVQQRLTDIRKLTKDPFDSAIGSVRSITQHFEELQNRIALTNEGIAFTTKQLREFSRIPFEIEGQIRSAGMNPQEGQGLIEFQKRVQEAEQQYIQTAKRVNELAGAEKQRIDTVKQAAVAEKFLAAEMQRVDSILTELNREHTDGSMLSERHAASVAKFSNSLKMAGVSGTQAAAQLEAYRGKMQQIEALENKRAQNRLANALAPQISDVAVSLAGGMPLHLVIMQQGLQIRDLIGQSGVAADKLQETMRNAMKNMVTSIGGTVAALAQMTGGALMDAGKGMSNLLLQVTRLDAGLEKLRYSLTLRGFAGDEVAGELAKGLAKVPAAVSVAAGALTGGMVVALTATAVAAYKAMKEHTELSKALNTSAASLGFTTASAYDYVEGISEVSDKTSVALSALTEMGKVGAFPAQAMREIIISAVEMEKAAGVAVSETVKNFAKLRDDPVKAVIELGKQTGYFSKEVIENIRQLDEQGRTLEASNLAMQEYAKGTKASAEAIISNYGTLERLAHGIATAFGNMWDAALGIGRPTGDLKALQSEADRLRKIANQDPDNLFAEQQAELAESAVRAAKALEQQAKAKAVNTENSRLLGEAEKIRSTSLNASQKYQQETNKLIALESSLRDKNLLTEKDALAIQQQKDKLYKDYMKSFEKEGKSGKSGSGKVILEEKSAVEELNEAFVKMTQTSEGYNEIQTRLLKVFASKEFAAMGDPQKVALTAQAEAMLELTGWTRKLTEEEKEANKVREETVKLRNQQVEAANKLILANQQSVADLDRKKEDVAFEGSLFGVDAETEKRLRADYDLKRRYEQAGLDFYKSVEEARKVLSQEQLDEELQKLGTRYNKAVELAQLEHQNKTRLMTDMEKRQQAFDDVLKRGFEQMGDSLIDFALTGKSSFGDMIQSMLIDLAKLEMRMQMMKWYESMGGSGKDGITGTLLKAAGSLFGLSSYDGGGFTGYGPRVGGIDGKGGSLAVVHPNETIIDHTKGQRMVAASGSNTKVDVVIINNSGAQVKQQETVDSRGNRKVEVVVGEMASGEVQRSGSAMQRGIGSTFGMRPALIAR